VDAGSILGVSALRTAFLDDISAASARQTQARWRRTDRDLRTTTITKTTKSTKITEIAKITKERARGS